ncbi:DEAD/DEAH box helicase [Nocardioides baekrokdamisoli]|uniref:DEAD/DEAH box helicase n=2 Tax=Nocardioides baekrokdamisoli TaxID=1804624 RepID=A0A3G9IBX4_9ACTN|nr:DEAD/DEAH box helicase [Nocardioides baekrokdamisoli]
MSLHRFSPATRAWFDASFVAPTPVQLAAWDAISAGQHALVVAPTGSGKTLSAFLWSLDRLLTTAPPEKSVRTRVLYISPLKALGVDVERNLRAPLVGIEHAAARLGSTVPPIRVGVRSGDTTAADRRRLQTSPPDILITTPESLFLMLTSRARESLRGIETVILDEVHAVAGSKRGTHLALSLERLDALLPAPAQRIGLSATVRPIEDVATFLGGAAPVSVVAPPSHKEWDLRIEVPVEDMTDLSRTEEDGTTNSIWPHVEERVAELIASHTSTIVFANSRRLAERLTSRLNDMSDSVVAKAHHGSVAKEQRAAIEDDLKAGRLPAVIATSSLELGIDMGAVDQVIQIESPPSIASALQRVGRAGHQVGEVSKGVLFPKHRGDLVPTAVAVERMRSGAIEALTIPANPLDVLAQQIVATVALEPWDVDELFALVRRAAPFHQLPRSAYEATLDLLAGLYPSEEFAELRPRIVWDRVSQTLTGRPGAQRLAVTSGGTIPDRGLFGVFLAGDGVGRRVGELDEEMVYESRVGDVFTLGTTSWRIEDITHDRVLVSPAPGQPGRLPFWKGDTMGRPAEFGEAIGRFAREVAALSRPKALARAESAGLDAYARENLVTYLHEQQAATGQLPSDHTLVLERFRDELGDWRLVLHSPYGRAVHAPWALAITARLRDRYAVDAPAQATDDGIVIRIPDTDQEPPGADLVLFEPDEIEALVTTEVGGSALFAARFRECAARALLLPRRDPGRRSPLWQQRQRSSALLQVASQYPSFPIVLEAVRECLLDVYDLPALVGVLDRIRTREIRVTEVETDQPSPYARSLLFSYVAEFLYDGDSPLAERRAAALSLDQGLLAELLGRAELRELLDPDVLDELESELQRTAPDRRARDEEGVADLLRVLGPLSVPEVGLRAICDPASALKTLTGRVVPVRIAGEERWAAIEDIGRLRDALGVNVPPGVPSAFAEPVADPLGDLVSRYARTHGPFTIEDVASRFGLGAAVVRHSLERLRPRILEGEFRPAGSGIEWCDAEVLRQIRRRSLAKLRREIEPVEPAVLGRFLPAWQNVTGRRLRGIDGVLTALDQIAGLVLPASAVEGLVLPARVSDYQPAFLDELTASGEVLWAGHGSLPGNDGWISLHLADSAGLSLPIPHPTDDGAIGWSILKALAGGGAWFFHQLAGAVREEQGAQIPDASIADALWELVWTGHISNDTLAPIRALISGRGAHKTAARPRVGSRARAVVRTGPPQTSGRWSLLPAASVDVTLRAQATAERLLGGYGIVTRGIAADLPGGFSGVYKVLSAYEDVGRCRRGYFVEGLGAAQFGTPGAVDRLRTYTDQHSSAAVTLAATDPANPYGAALPWPATADGHRPGRKAGAVVVLVDGELALYVERGGKTLLTFAVDDLGAAAGSLAAAARAGALGRLTIQKADGSAVLGGGETPIRAALEAAGFVVTPRGLRLRS